MTGPKEHSWDEIYLIHDLYSAWCRVESEWLYTEGFYCSPTATIETPSESEAKKLATAWTRFAGGNWSVRAEGRDAIAISREWFELEEAQNYTEPLDGFRKPAGLKATVCSVYALGLEELSEGVLRKIRKLMGASGGGEDEEDVEMGEPLTLALLRRGQEFPRSYPQGRLAVSGRIVAGGLSGIRVMEHEGHKTKDLTEVCERALRATQAFMKEHGIREKSFWPADEKASWKAPGVEEASRLADRINEYQGSAEAKGDTVQGLAREIWSLVSYQEFYGRAADGPTKAPPTGKGPFAGEVVCFTGRLESMEREDAQALVASLGGASASSITSSVTLVVAARAASSKRAKAEKRGLPIIDEKEFLRRAGR